MKKSQLRNIIRESIKQMMAEQLLNEGPFSAREIEATTCDGYYSGANNTPQGNPITQGLTWCWGCSPNYYHRKTTIGGAKPQVGMIFRNIESEGGTPTGVGTGWHMRVTWVGSWKTGTTYNHAAISSCGAGQGVGSYSYSCQSPNLGSPFYPASGGCFVDWPSFGLGVWSGTSAYAINYGVGGSGYQSYWNIQDCEATCSWDPNYTGQTEGYKCISQNSWGNTNHGNNASGDGSECIPCTTLEIQNGTCPYATLNDCKTDPNLNDGYGCRVIRYACHDCNTPGTDAQIMHYYNLGQASGAMITNGWYAPYLWDTTATCNQLCAGAGTWKCAMPDKFGAPQCAECTQYDNQFQNTSISTVTCFNTKQECLDSNCGMRRADDIGKTQDITPLTTDPLAKIDNGYCEEDEDCNENEQCENNICVSYTKITAPEDEFGEHPDDMHTIDKGLISRMQEIANIKKK